ncbi:hypothetical protein GA0061098_1018186 [Bradyrhizobium shewense]|uniref:Uncharacterized protein n=1 Tax=Bradyrhizobium shewense TaxID=1761772 RepID=A0A1C3XLU4_9BRAD|nr:hypothetical protein GA0061098_1018186 [Bradyrhizobium shewense]
MDAWKTHLKDGALTSFEVKAQKIDFGFDNIGERIYRYIQAPFWPHGWRRLSQEDALPTIVRMVTIPTRVELLPYLAKQIAKVICAKFKRGNCMDELCNRVA